MRQVPRWGYGPILMVALVAGLTGAGPGSKTKGIPDLKKERVPIGEEVVRDVAYLQLNNTIKVEGVGLVVGLDGTGSNPEPSGARSKLLDRMRKAGVENPEKWLESPTTSLVLVRGTIPPGISNRDKWDIEIELNPNSTTTSLAGGYLLTTPLTVVQIVDGQAMSGQEIATAGGPVLIPDPKNRRLGRVLGGAMTKKDLPHMLILKSERKGYRTAAQVQNVINQRFFRRKGVDQIGLAQAKTDEYLTLEVPHVYHDNQFRYFQVIERLHLVENPDLRSRRMQQWGKDLLDPRTAGEAALRLEGVGRNAIETLKPALASPSPQVQFFAAEALAYLGDPTGVDVIAKAAAEQPGYRAFAFAALAALDEPASALRLRALMSQADPTVRYGAFCALRTLDPRDPFLGRVRVLRDEPEPDQEGDDMALRLHSAPRRARPLGDDPFELYMVECDGPPSIHVARSRRCEIVVFGRGQKLLTPAVLGGSGPYLLNASLDQNRIEISRIGAGDADLKTVCSDNVGEIIRSLANLGATYPDVLAILDGADRQKNLEGPVVIDALPKPSREYDEAQLAGVDASSAPKKDGAIGRASLNAEENPPPPSRKSFLDRFRFRK